MNVERNPTNAAVVGVGNMGRHHARVYSELPNVNLVGVFDVDDEQAREVAEDHGTRAMDMDALLDAADVASIAVPTQFHADIASDCIDHGVDVLVEKPFVDDPAVGRQLIERADDAGVTIQVGHIERFNPAIRALADIVADLDVIAVEAHRLGPPPEDRGVDESAVLDLMIHDVDVVLAMLGEAPENVTANGVKNNQYATASLEFGDGTVASLTASRVTQQRVRKLSITAESCRVNVDYIDRSVEIHRHSLPEYIEDNGDVRYRHESIVERPTVETGEPLKNQLESFVAAATSDADPVVSGEDGLRVLEVVRRIDDIAADERRPAEVSAR
ncbi:Gfo/Idh/MocA family protein [Halorussus sp. MSC15.2]|uniref:Gfo/Idh/MocA family protein n=1 Tax=Halorussus sp. MSC15.2 TaxID=2283638 RepID=UPI0013D7ACEC|nr:Gfo/Idh/MocA family oxidoreductase [Halorussus sp. MSC15.2]NEU56508.1 Gfo/Idh/MocA family oxidoreductase [Halorussus sp. MSC15.2]